MSDVDEIIDYIKSLKRGFDKDLFQSKINDLAQAVDTAGLDYEDFHSLFKIWLNLSIPITKWLSIGLCLVPQSNVTEQTVDYALRWLLANTHNQLNFSRVAFLLDWLTAAMDCESIDIAALDGGYEVFFSFLTYELLASHALKLVYTLTKPTDVTRVRALELFDYARKRESKKSHCRQLHVLLGLFKSYKPELVPEDIPAVPVHTTFKSNITLLTRFKRCQDQRNYSCTRNNHLMWTNPMLGGKNKKTESLVPSIEFLNIHSQQYADKESQKTHLDFTDAESLVQHDVRRGLARPARLRALLRHAAGLVLLALGGARAHAALQLDLLHMLPACFLEVSPYSEAEKCDLLHRVAALQRALCQPLRAVSAFLAQWLPLWDETSYFAEILELLEWVDPACAGLGAIVDSAAAACLRAAPARRAALLRALVTMYANLVYGSTRSRQHFASEPPPRAAYEPALRRVGAAVHAACARQLQADPDDIRVVYWSVQAARRMGAAELRARRAPAALPAPTALALPLLAASAELLEQAAALLLLYKKILFSVAKENKKDDKYQEHKQMLSGYTADVFRCLAEEAALSGRQGGFVFRPLHPQLAQKLLQYSPDADSAFSIRNHLAFVPYTLQMDTSAASANELLFEININKEFPHLYTLLSKLGFGRKIAT